MPLPRTTTTPATIPMISPFSTEELAGAEGEVVFGAAGGTCALEVEDSAALVDVFGVAVVAAGGIEALDV